MWKLVLCGGLLVIAGAVSETAQAQERSPTTVEGYVFNKWTGVPLEGARMLLTFGNPEIAIGEPLPAGQLITDSNGFYSIEIQSGQLIGLSANCFFQKRGESRGASVSIHLPRPAEGLIERNAYLEVPRSRLFKTCTGLSR
jgi:hypothetical protein